LHNQKKIPRITLDILFPNVLLAWPVFHISENDKHDSWKPESHRTFFSIGF
jgi:hypothetical protein